MTIWLPIVVSVLLTTISSLILARSIRVRTGRQAALDEIQREIGAMVTELNQTAERNIALIEDRIVRMNELVRQADGRLRGLGHEIARIEQTSGDAKSPGPVVKGEPAARSRPPSDTQAVSQTYSDLKRFRVAGTPKTNGSDASIGLPEDEAPSAPTPPAPTPSPPTPPEVRSSSTRSRIRELYRQGIPLDRIARVVGVSIGEIELVVSLDEGSR
ncbi:MAG: hypothetical protein EA382_10315 [Spirochaetaceae bacterium]|nr:MAG: hypothetical protein EA382_10315 [Spirochaetaceae bacterium]